jgi:hypothetical protein
VDATRCQPLFLLRRNMTRLLVVEAQLNVVEKSYLWAFLKPYHVYFTFSQASQGLYCFTSFSIIRVRANSHYFLEQ